MHGVERLPVFTGYVTYKPLHQGSAGSAAVKHASGRVGLKTPAKVTWTIDYGLYACHADVSVSDVLVPGTRRIYPRGAVSVLLLSPAHMFVAVGMPH